MLALTIDLGTRRRLGPNEPSDPTTRDWIVPTRTVCDLGASSGPHDDGPGRYDVDRALRSDESTRAEDVEPEGLGPARRRYVLEDAAPVRVSITLVRDVSGITLRRSRRFPF